VNCNTLYHMRLIFFVNCERIEIGWLTVDWLIVKWRRQIIMTLTLLSIRRVLVADDIPCWHRQNDGTDQKREITFDVKHDDFALHRTGVDRTAVLALIVRLNVSYLQVPLFGVGSHDREPRVINHSTLLVGEWDWAVIEPCNLHQHLVKYL